MHYKIPYFRFSVLFFHKFQQARPTYKQDIRGQIVSTLEKWHSATSGDVAQTPLLIISSDIRHARLRCIKLYVAEENKAV